MHPCSLSILSYQIRIARANEAEPTRLFASTLERAVSCESDGETSAKRISASDTSIPSNQLLTSDTSFPLPTRDIKKYLASRLAKNTIHSPRAAKPRGSSAAAMCTWP